MDDKLTQKQREEVLKVVQDYMKSSAFIARKLTDTPTDDLQVVNRKYVTLNGVSALRPSASVVGQSYFDTTLGLPVWWDGSTFVDATGTPA